MKQRAKRHMHPSYTAARKEEKSRGTRSRKKKSRGAVQVRARAWPGVSCKCTEAALIFYDITTVDSSGKDGMFLCRKGATLASGCA